MDKYYSPAWLAHALCDHFSVMPGARIFDPTMGAGALLHAAVEQGSTNELVIMGCDIDPRTVRSVQTEQPEWVVGRADIFSEGSRRQSKVWKTAKSSGVDIVLMNPPFSFRGKHRKNVSLFGKSYSLTPAVAALATVLNDVAVSQGVGVILPSGSLYGEADEMFWDAVERIFDVDVAQDLPRGSFPDAHASSALLTLRKRVAGSSRLDGLLPVERLVPKFAEAETCKCIEVIRGRVQTSTKVEPDNDSVPFIHTTNLRHGKVVRGEQYRPVALSTWGPMLLLPRVGRFYFEKLVLADSQRLVLSDCIIALRTGNPKNLDSVRSALAHPALAFERAYGGTGAPYITIRKIMSKLLEIGLVPRHVPASNGPFECTCRVSRPMQTAS